jgi:hypothetical protein
VFIDEKIGELQHEIAGNPKLPIPVKKSPFITTVDTKDPFDFVIPKINHHLFRAINKLIENFLDPVNSDIIRNLKE